MLDLIALQEVSSAQRLNELVPTIMILQSRRAVCFASVSGSEDELRIFNFGDSGGNNGTIRCSFE